MATTEGPVLIRRSTQHDATADGRPALVAAAGWDRRRARDGDLDGRFLIGQMVCGRYCLPSCSLKRSRNEEIRLFVTEAAARYAGLRACRQCRPEAGYDGEARNLVLYEQLSERVATAPAAFPDVSVLLTESGLEPDRLVGLFRDHGHLSPGRWLERTKIRAAAQALLAGARPTTAFARDAGFADRPAFELAFTQRMRLPPARYGGLAAASAFALSLPSGYRAVEVLAYHGRDPASPTERRAGNRIWKALMTDAGPVVLEVTVGARAARVTVHAERPLGGGVMGRLHASSLAMLGLDGDVEPFETEHRTLVAGREGLRVALLPGGFEALSWGIIGQQINLAFAASLRREVIALAGVPIGSMRAHPTAQAVARIAPSDLRARRFSRAKADYLIDAANAVASGTLPLDRLLQGSAVAAERALTERRGVGIWTARYVLMRTGFADAAPVGDSGLATALQRLLGIARRPDAGQTARLMSRFSPDRALASAHLWASLHGLVPVASAGAAERR